MSAVKVVREIKSPKDSGDASQLADDGPAKQRVSLVVVHAADQPWSEAPSKAALEMIPMIRDLRDDTSAILPAGLRMVETTPHYAFIVACTSIVDGSKCFLPCHFFGVGPIDKEFKANSPSAVELSLLLQTLRICSAQRMPVR